MVRRSPFQHHLNAVQALTVFHIQYIHYFFMIILYDVQLYSQALFQVVNS